MSQPKNVTPRCLKRIEALPSVDRHADAAPKGASRAMRVPIEPDPGRFADQVLLGHEAPGAPVVAVVAVVAHHQILPRGHLARPCRGSQESRGILVAADVTAQAAAVAPGQHRRAVDGHRTEYRLVLVAAKLLR